MTDPELLALLARAKGYKMTPEELREQRITFVYGNVAFDNPTITREQVEAILFGEDDRARAAAEYVRDTANMTDDAAARYRGTFSEGAEQTPVERDWGFRFGYAQAAPEKDCGI